MAKSLKVLFAEDSQDDVELTVNELLLSGYVVCPQRVEARDEMAAALL